MAAEDRSPQAIDSDCPQPFHRPTPFILTTPTILEILLDLCDHLLGTFWTSSSFIVQDLNCAFSWIWLRDILGAIFFYYHFPIYSWSSLSLSLSLSLVLSRSLSWYINTYIHTYIHTYFIHTYIHTYIHAYIQTYRRTPRLSFQHTRTNKHKQ